MTMNAEQQYIELFSQTEAMICKHSAEVLNAPRAAAFADFERIGFPTRKMEKYKYTDVSKYFEPDFGLNLNRLAIPVNPYEVFKCDVPNMSTALYFVVNDAFYDKVFTCGQSELSRRELESLPEPFDKEMAELYQEMEAQRTLEARIYKALDKLEALIQHNESDIKTWIPLEYDLQMTYGDEQVKFSDYLTELRDQVREDSVRKIECNRKEGTI